MQARPSNMGSRRDEECTDGMNLQSQSLEYCHTTGVNGEVQNQEQESAVTASDCGKVLCVEGNIASGKTSFIRLLDAMFPNSVKVRFYSIRFYIRFCTI